MANLGKLVVAITATTKGLEKAAKKSRSILGGLAKSATSLPTILTGVGIGAAAVGLGRIADEYAIMGSQLEFLTGSADEAEDAQARLYDISKKTGTQMTDNASAFVKLTQAQAKTGLTTEENLDTIETLNALMIKTGTSGVQASSAMLQLSQALTSGKLAGDEFRSISENAPGLLIAIADAAGIAQSDMKEMSAAGELTSKVLADAFLSIRDAGVASFEDLPSTMQRGINAVVTAFEFLWAKISDENGIIASFENAMFDLTGYIEDNGDAIGEWVSNAWGQFLDNAPDLLKTIENIGEGIKWLSGWVWKAIEGWSFLIEQIKAFQIVQEGQDFLTGQQRFTENQLRGSGFTDEQIAGAGLTPSGGTVIYNNINQNLGTNEINQITSGQTTQSSRL